MTTTNAESLNVSDIFKKYRSQLKSYINKRVLSKEDGEDILQNVFYQLSKVDMLENPIEQISSWLYSVTRNQIVDRSRKQKEVAMPYINSGSDNDSFLTEITETLLFDKDASPENEYLRSLVWKELELALNDLPVEQREIFELTELEGFSFKEISAVSGVAVNTLISRKRYAVLHLRECLRHLYTELLED
ncbi:RNA polymerase sigma factor [Dysgonomonas sp. ZJ279]|uniref:RNA polymerase sigma factor n=1 Tax=Dysgonomonas sp. ZJ279 TaxID=2709796 RepID=UPI0013EBFCB8|nr:RNA polymerase sigma factor [Dysgonomonas sp. ZJ279]